MILKNPTIFGYDNGSGSFLGGGEAGEEVVTGKNSLLSMIRKAVASVQMASNRQFMQGMSEAMQAAKVNISYGDIHMTINGAPGQDIRELADIVATRIKNSYDKERAVWA